MRGYLCGVRRYFISCLYTTSSISREIRCKRDAAHIGKVVRVFLLDRYGSLRWSSTGDSFHFKAHRGFVTGTGKIILHLGLFFIVIGFLTGAITRLDGFMYIEEGETSSVLVVAGGDETFRLPFSVKLDRLHIEYYENGTPSKVLSEISISKDGTEENGSVSVNSPYRCGRFSLFLVAYGMWHEGERTRYYNQLRVVSDPGLPLTCTGAFLLLLGVFLTFLFSGFQITVEVAPLEKATVIVFSGVTHGFKVPLEKEVKYLMDSIVEIAEEGSHD